MSSPLQPVSFGDARQKLKVSKHVFNALLRSRLLVVRREFSEGGVSSFDLGHDVHHCQKVQNNLS